MQSDDTSISYLENYAIPAGLTVTAIHTTGWLADISVTAIIREPTLHSLIFTPVPSAPGPQQYSVAAGVYTFNAADVGTTVILVYSYRENNRRLHLVIIWGMGEIQAVNQLYLDDVAITDPRFNGFAYYENYTG